VKQKPVPAGDLDQRVIIQARTDASSDGVGGGPVDWQDADERWAKVEPLSGSERIQAAAMTATVSHRVTMRAPLMVSGWDEAFQEDAFQADAFEIGSDLSAAMRLSWKNRILEVNAIIESPEMRGFLVLDCSQVQL
jgi:head-tail adaptor